MHNTVKQIWTYFKFGPDWKRSEHSYTRQIFLINGNVTFFLEKTITGCQVSYFFLFFPIFWKIPIFFYFFLFFTKIPIFSLFFSNFFRLSYYFSQKLKEPSEIRRISCLGKSHSCEIASLWSFPPKSPHDQPASVVLPQSRVLIHSFMTVRVFGYVFCVYFRIYERKFLLMLTSQICPLACTLMKQRQHRQRSKWIWPSVTGRLLIMKSL